jgi:hypothetical protein
MRSSIKSFLYNSKQSGNLLFSTVQADQIAVSGHSWGGLAALALTGGDDLAGDRYTRSVQFQH